MSPTSGCGRHRGSAPPAPMPRRRPPPRPLPRRRATPPAARATAHRAYDELDGVASRLGKITRGAGGGAAPRGGRRRPPAPGRPAPRPRAEQPRPRHAQPHRRAGPPRPRERGQDRRGPRFRGALDRARRGPHLGDVEGRRRAPGTAPPNVAGEALAPDDAPARRHRSRVSEGHQTLDERALKAVEKVEQHLAKLEARRREDARPRRRATRQAGGPRRQDRHRAARLRERIAAISERIAAPATPVAGGAGSRGPP